MTDKFTEQYQYEVSLCNKMIHHCCHSKRTENLKFSEIREALLLFFSPETVQKATSIFLQNKDE